MNTCSCCDEVKVGWVEFKVGEVRFCAQHETFVVLWVEQYLKINPRLPVVDVELSKSRYKKLLRTLSEYRR